MMDAFKAAELRWQAQADQNGGDTKQAWRGLIRNRVGDEAFDRIRIEWLDDCLYEARLHIEGYRPIYVSIWGPSVFFKWQRWFGLRYGLTTEFGEALCRSRRK